MHFEVMGGPVGEIEWGEGIHLKWSIPRVLAQYRLRMRTTCGGGGGV
jgi:hypothetical protein